MPNVVRFALESARDLYVPGVGWFTDGIHDVDANNLKAVGRARFLVQPYRATELGIVDSGEPYPNLPAPPAAPIPDPYAQYLLPSELGPAMTTVLDNYNPFTVALQDLIESIAGNIDESTLGSPFNIPDTVMRRDGTGQVAVRVLVLDDVTVDGGPQVAARRDYVDALGTADATGSTVMRRYPDGSVAVSALYIGSGAGNTAARTSDLDNIGTNLATPSTVVRRDGAGYTTMFGITLTGNPADAEPEHAARRDYVDGQVATRSARALSKRTISTSYTLVASDAIDTVVHSTSASAITITLPQDSAASIAQEIAIPWRAYGAGQITFAAGTGATIISRGSALKSAGQYAEGLVTKVAANTWLVSGDVTT